MTIIGRGMAQHDTGRSVVGRLAQCCSETWIFVRCGDQLSVQRLTPCIATALERNLSRRQACARGEFQHELIVHNGSIDGQLRYFKLDGIFLLA